MAREKQKDETPVKVAGAWVPLDDVVEGDRIDAISYPTTAPAIAAMNASRVTQ